MGEALDTPGMPQEQLRNERREFQENWVFQAWGGLAAPEGPKIAGGASLARRRKARFPAIR